VQRANKAAVSDAPEKFIVGSWRMGGRVLAECLSLAKPVCLLQGVHGQIKRWLAARTSLKNGRRVWRTEVCC